MNFLFNIEINGYPLCGIVWNIFLGLIPCILSWRFYKHYKDKKWKKASWSLKIYFIVLFPIWLFFFPNTAYLFTAVRYLVDHCVNYDPVYRVCREEAWMEIFFFTYAFTGVPVFIYALKRMGQAIGGLFGKMMEKLFPIIIIPITAMGVLLGLLERFNSWEIIYNPFLIVKAGIGYFSDPDMLLNVVVYTIALYLIYYMTLFFVRRFKI